MGDVEQAARPQPHLPRPHGRHRHHHQGGRARLRHHRPGRRARPASPTTSARTTRTSVYDRFDFDVPVGSVGDNFDRYAVRVEEIQQSMRILDQALEQIPAGPVMRRRPAHRAAAQERDLQHDRGDDRATSSIIMDGIHVPPGEVYSFTEGGNGELGFYIVSDGTGPPVEVPRAPALLPGDRGADQGAAGPVHRRRRADLRHDQHDRRGVRSLMADTDPTNASSRDWSPSPSTARPHQFPKGTKCSRPATHARRRRPVLLLPPRAVVAAPSAGSAWSTSRGSPKLVPSCYTPVADKMEVDDRVAARAGRAPADARVHAGQPPDRLPDLRQGGRVHAAEALLRLGREARASTTASRSRRTRSSTSARTSCSTRSAASCARAASASATRSPATHQLEMAHRGDHEVLTTAPGHKLDNPYSLNTVDVCPVGALTAKDFRFAMRAWELVHDAVGLPGLRHRLQHRGPPLARPDLPPGAARTTPTSTSTGCATRGASPTSACTTERLAAPLSGGSPVDWDRALDDAGKLLRAALDAEPRHGRRRVQRAVDQRGPLRAGAAGVRPPARRQAPTWPGWTRAGATTSCVSADKNPNTAGAMAIGAGRLRSLLDLAERPEGGRGHGAARRRHATACWARRRRAAALPLDRLQTLVAIGTHRDGVVAARARRAAAGRVGRGRRHVHQPPGHGPAHARRRRRPRATRCPAGRSCRTWRASWAPRWSSSRPRRCSPRPSRSCRS